jgi:hypothetical protein
LYCVKLNKVGKCVRVCVRKQRESNAKATRTRKRKMHESTAKATQKQRKSNAKVPQIQCENNKKATPHESKYLQEISHEQGAAGLHETPRSVHIVPMGGLRCESK